jgi:hypothetical protein
MKIQAETGWLNVNCSQPLMVNCSDFASSGISDPSSFRIPAKHINKNEHQYPLIKTDRFLSDLGVVHWVFDARPAMKIDLR